MANPVFDPERALGLKVTKMDRQELCEFVSALCHKGRGGGRLKRGRRGGIPSNISVDDNGGIAIGPAGKAPGRARSSSSSRRSCTGTVSSRRVRRLFRRHADVLRRQRRASSAGGRVPRRAAAPHGRGRLPRAQGGGAQARRDNRKVHTLQGCRQHQTLDELRAVLDSCIKNLYLSDVPSAEAIFKKNDDDLSDIERMMVGIIEKRR